MRGNLFVISGPSGSGKSTICSLLEKEDKIKISISATTRDKRTGEVDGVNYFFLTKEEFEKKIKENAFYEYANVFNNYYGTLKAKLDELEKAAQMMAQAMYQQQAAQGEAPNSNNANDDVVDAEFKEK